MNNLNSIIVEGNLVRDAVLSEPAEGFKVCKFSLAVNRFYKNRNDQGVEEVSFFDVETFGKMAEYCEKKGYKGRGVRVVGRLKQDVWKTDDNKTMSKVYIVAEHIEYKPSFSKNGENKKDSDKENIPVEALVTKCVESPVEETVF